MLTIKDLAEILVQKHQLDSRSAEAFINAVIETIHEGLKNDRVVKVKGFGTFKLTAVRERESINVNTGERVVISGHDKVSFTPDAVLRDLVNKPFAQFDTVVLADGVAFEDMPEVETEDADIAAEEAAEIPVQEEAKAVAEQVEQVEQVEHEPEPTPEPEPVVVPVAEPEPEVEEGPVAEDEPETDPEPEPAVEEPVIEEPVAEDPQPEEPVEPEAPATPEVEEEEPEMPESPVVPETPETPEVPETPTKEPEPEQEEEQEDYISQFYEDEESDSKRMFLIYAIIVNVVVAALFFVFGYYARSSNLLGIEKEPVVEAPAAPAVEQPDTTKQKAVEPAAPAETTEEPAVEKTEEKPVEESKPVAEPKKEEKPEAKVEQTSKYDNDPRVRTGAYRIVGVANTVTVKSGQTIKSISKAYLGPGMECYVEAFNGGITELKEGQTIKIPKLQHKKKSAKAKK
jgi:nucleoid DNA-binding protein